nr:PRC-barrel domain-containing protein [Halococcus qingdaonensis]
MMDTNDIDPGTDVYDVNGEEVGTVADVENDTAYVDLDPGLTDEVKANLGFGDTDDDTYALRDEMVDTVDDDGVHLRGTH